MKKLLSILLAVAMIMAFSLPVVAAEEYRQQGWEAYENSLK